MTTVIITGMGRKENLGTKVAAAIKALDPDTTIIGVANQATDSVSLADYYYMCELSDTEVVRDVFTAISNKFPTIDQVINCAGSNGIYWLEDLESDEFDRQMGVNARAIYEITQTLLPQLTRSNGTVLNIVSNAAHIPMTNSLAYNASKAAAGIITKQLARELTQKNGITVFSISPNKLKGTGMSKYIEERVPELRGWTPEQAAKYQEGSLLAGETDPDVLAEFIAFILSTKQRHQYFTGCDIPYGL